MFNRTWLRAHVNDIVLYIVIAVLVALVVIGALVWLTQSSECVFCGVNNNLYVSPATPAPTAAGVG
jgi:Flp pilus assembly pilin Flp